MKKYFSRIIIPFFVLAILFGAFGVGKVEAVGNADCSQLTGDALGVCQVYNRNAQPGASYVEFTAADGTIRRARPNGSLTTLKINGNTVTETADNTVVNYNENTGKIVVAKPDGTTEVIQGTASAPQGDSFGKILGGSIADTFKNAWGTALNIGAGIFAGPWFLAIATALTGILAILSGLLSIVAAVFDGVIHLSIGGFKEFVTSSNIIESWVLVRDVINICFIFILLYIAITTIIGGAGIKTKVQLKNVIIGAILINFSLFFTRFLIDAGNIVAVTLYTKLSATSYGTGVWGLTGKIMNGLNLPGLFSVELLKISGQTNAIFILILSIILVGLTLWAFLYGAILFLLRNIMLLFLMAISPIGFIGGTLPWFEKRSSEWWSSLIGQVMVAPFFLFIMYMLIRFIDASANIRKLVETKDFWSGSNGLDYAMYINAFLIIGLLVVGVKTTKTLAGKMGSMAEGVINSAIVAATATLTGGASALATRLSTRGATLATRGAAIYNSANSSTSRIGRFATRVGGAMVQGAGRNIELASGIGIRNAAGQPNALGVALTNMKKSFFDNTKKQTGIDLDSAMKYNEKMNKEYEKRYGDIANKIGGKKEREELDVLKNISTNIKNQSESRAKKNHKPEWDNLELMPIITPADRKAKKDEFERLTSLMKTEGKALATTIAQEMGVDLVKHEARKDELDIIIENKTIEKNQYAAKIPDKKIANQIRSQATYQSKDKVEDDLAKIIKKLSTQNNPPAPNPAP